MNVPHSLLVDTLRDTLARLRHSPYHYGTYGIAKRRVGLSLWLTRGGMQKTIMVS